MQCPNCQNNKAYKNGYNIVKGGVKVQKYYCPICEKSFQIK